MKHVDPTIFRASCLFLAIAAIMTTGCQQQPDASKTLKPLTDKYVDVWNGGNLNDLDTIIDPHFAYHSNLEVPVEGLDGLKKIITGFRASYPDLKIVLEEEVYSENKAAARWTLTGTNTGPGEMSPTGKAVKIWGVSVLNYANGKISAEWLAFDNQAFVQQLGYTMAPSSKAKE